MTFKNIHTIRYMGTKANLLDFIIPEIQAITPEGGTVCDLMAGTNAVGYALNAVVAVAVLAAIMSTIFIIVRNADKISSYMSKNGSGMGKCFVSMLCSVFIISILYGLYTFITSVGPM